MAYTGEIRMIACTFAPYGWALCNGQLLEIREYMALATLFGRTYGGNGTTTFGLPDLRGRIPVHQMSGSSDWPLGHKVGTETVTLSEAQMASHNHPMQAGCDIPNTKEVCNNIICRTGDIKFYRKSPSSEAKETNLHLTAVDFAGGGNPHGNMMPYQCINFIVCLDGDYPPRE